MIRGASCVCDLLELKYGFVRLLSQSEPADKASLIMFSFALRLSATHTLIPSPPPCLSLSYLPFTFTSTGSKYSLQAISS